MHMNERELDRYCWTLVSWRNRFYPPDETAEECIEEVGTSDSNQNDTDEYGNGHEYGYHLGMFIAFDEAMEQLYNYGINVMARANRYTKVNREHGMEFRTEDEPPYYLAAKGGAEVKAVTSSLYDSIEIESIGPAPYTPKGAESE